MFTWLNKQGVRSASGFEFQFTGRFTAEYREHGRVTDMYVEGSGSAITIYDGSLERLWSGIADAGARAAERERVIANIRDALMFQELRLDLVIGPEPRY